MKTKLTDKTFNPNLNEKLRYLKLNNFKGFSKNTEIYFSPTINLLYGKNSSGKSTIIQSLRLLKQSLLVRGSPSLFLSNIPSYMRIPGNLIFQEGFKGIINEKDIKKDLEIGVADYGVERKDSNGLWRGSRFLINTYNNKDNESHPSIKKMRFGRYDCNDVKKIEDWSKYSEFDLVFKKKKFKKGELANLLTSVLEDSRFDEEGFNINGRLNNKNLEDTSELVYEELDIKNSKFTFKILNNIYNKITNDKKIIKNINLLIEFGLSKTLGIDTSKLGKLTKKNKKGRLTRNKHFNAGEYGQIPSKDLIKLKKFVNSKSINNKEKLIKFFIDDYKKKIKLIRYKDRLIDIASLRTNYKMHKKSIEEGFMRPPKYHIYLINLVLDALEKPKLDVETSFYTSLTRLRDMIENIVVVPGLRELPQRYLKRGLSETFVGEKAENLGDILKHGNNIKKVNYWFNKFEIPYSIDVKEVGNFYEIIMKSKNKNKKSLNLSYRDVGLGYSLSLPLIVTCLTNSNSIILVEEPELHLHPKLQASLMDLFLFSSIENKNQFIVETHSENLLLRAQKSIRRGYKYKNNILKINKNLISVNNIYVDEGASMSQKINLSDTGEFKTHWKDGFFADRLDELF